MESVSICLAVLEIPRIAPLAEMILSVSEDGCFAGEDLYPSLLLLSLQDELSVKP